MFGTQKMTEKAQVLPWRPSVAEAKNEATIADRIPDIAQPDTAPPETAPAEATSVTQPASNHNKSILKVVVAVAALALATGGWNWYVQASKFQETDDAYTTGHMHAISARISDTVEKVLVDDNEHVKAGQVLVQLDPTDYDLRVAELKAALQTAQRQATAAQAAIGFADTSAGGKSTEAAGQIAGAQADIKRAENAVIEAQSAVLSAQAQNAQRQAEEQHAAIEYQRYQKLALEGAVSLEQRDQALRDYHVASEATKASVQSIRGSASRLAQAQEAVLSAKARLTQSQGVLEQAKATHLQTDINSRQFEVAQSAIEQAAAQLKNAETQLSYTQIVAPVDGRVGKKTVEAGQRVQPGQQLMDVVSDDAWVLGNFKETQLEHMRPGQPVEVRIDAYPHHTFTGKVDSMSPGSGASFALLPPDNATGNFTKIVQRVPVKVVFDRDSIKGFEQLLVPGMSAVVKVRVQ